MGAGLPSGEGLHLCQAIHAEINALVQCRNIDDIYSVYTTSSPCVLCMRVIVGTGVKRIVFREAYPHVESYLMAKERDIEWLLLPK
jgi:dCMP deaminase